MDIRNIQKTGNMFYMYLPTTWVKKFGIKSQSKVSVALDGQGNLIISPKMREEQEKHLELKFDTLDKDILIKLIVSCYLNPVSSFKIILSDKSVLKELLNDKNDIGALEFVNVERDEITFESTITIKNPLSLFKTMLSKVKSIILLFEENSNRQLINVYEREIDRSKLLIDKAMITALNYTDSESLKTIDLFYITVAARDIERMVDNLVESERLNKKFLQEIYSFADELHDIMEHYDAQGLSSEQAIGLVKKAMTVKSSKLQAPSTYQQLRAASYVGKVAETFLDWAITNEVSATEGKGKKSKG